MINHIWYVAIHQIPFISFQSLYFLRKTKKLMKNRQKNQFGKFFFYFPSIRIIQSNHNNFCSFCIHFSLLNIYFTHLLMLFIHLQHKYFMPILLLNCFSTFKFVCNKANKQKFWNKWKPLFWKMFNLIFWEKFSGSRVANHKESCMANDRKSHSSWLFYFSSAR